MSWSSYESAIINVFDANGYTLVPENKIADVSSQVHKHLAYTVKWLGHEDITYFTSNKTAYSNNVMIEVNYINIDQVKKTENIISFNSLVTAIVSLSGFIEYTAKFEDIDTKHSKGTIELLIGVESAC